MPACLNKIITETCQFLLFYLTFGERAYDSASAGSPKVNSKEILFIFHYSNLGRYFSELFYFGCKIRAKFRH